MTMILLSSSQAYPQIKYEASFLPEGEVLELKGRDPLIAYTEDQFQTLIWMDATLRDIRAKNLILESLNEAEAEQNKYLKDLTGTYQSRNKLLSQSIDTITSKYLEDLQRLQKEAQRGKIKIGLGAGITGVVLGVFIGAFFMGIAK